MPNRIRIVTFASLLFAGLAGPMPHARGVPNPTPSDGPAFLHRLPARAETFLYVPDPSPWIRTILRSDRLGAALDASRLFEGEASEGKARPSEKMAEMAGKADAFLAKAPLEIALGTSAAAPRELVGVMRTAFLLWAGRVLATAGPEAQAATLPLLRQDLVAKTRQLTLPRLIAWARLQPRPRAEAMFNQVSGAIQGFAGPKGLTVQEGTDHVTLDITLGHFLPRENLVAMLQGIGLGEPGDADFDPVADRLSGLRLSLSVHLMEDGLRLTVGDWSAPGGELPLAGLPSGALWEESKELALYARWDGRALIDGLDDMKRLWDRWSLTPVAERIREVDTQDFLGDLGRMGQQLRNLPLLGEARIRAGSTIEASMRCEGTTAIPELAGSNLAMLVPKGMDMVFADMSSSAGESASRTLDRLESRLEQMKLRLDLAARRGNTKARQVELFNAIYQTYHENMGPFRKVIHEQAGGVFLSPTAWLWDAGDQGLLSGLRVSTGGEKPSTMELSRFPISRQAMISRSGTPDSVRAFFDALYASLPGRKPGPVAPSITVPVDLDLGVPTFAFTSPSDETGITWSTDGDFRLHVFFVGDHVVLSDSTSLSREILQAQRSGPEAREVLGEPGDGRFLHGLIPGPALARSLGLAGELIRSFGPEDPRGKVTGPLFEPLPTKDLQTMSRIFEGIGDVSRIIDRIHWWGRQKDSVRELDLRVSFRDPAPPPGK